MPQINLCFQGWLRGVEIKQVFDVHGEPVDVSEVSSKEVADKLKSGEWSISLHDALDNADDSEIQLHDFEECV